MVVLVIAIFLISRGCQREGTEITQDEAVEIAKDAIDYVPDRVVVRFVRRGTGFSPNWAVSLTQEREGDQAGTVTVVVVDARTGEVVEIGR